MSNGSRHLLGILAGLLLPPLMALLLIYGVEGLPKIGSAVPPEAVAGTLAVSTRLALVAGAAIIFAYLTGSRLSPIAAFLGGAAFTAAGSLWMFYPRQTATVIQNFPIGGLEASLQTLVYHGIFLLIGVAMLYSAFLPSRWRALRRRDAPVAADDTRTYAPMRTDEAEVVLRTDGQSYRDEPHTTQDIPGYRFLPKESGGSSASHGLIDPTISSPDSETTQELEPRQR